MNFVSTNNIQQTQMEPMPDVYSRVPTYPAANNVVNYNASPNPQYTSPNFNHFNDHVAQPPHIPGNYHKREYQDYQPKPSVQQEKPSEKINPTTESYDFSSDLK